MANIVEVLGGAKEMVGGVFHGIGNTYDRVKKTPQDAFYQKTPGFNIGADWIGGGLVMNAERSEIVNGIYPLPREWGIDNEKVKLLMDEKSTDVSRWFINSTAQYFPEGESKVKFLKRGATVNTLGDALALMNEYGAYGYITNSLIDRLPKTRSEQLALAGKLVLNRYALGGTAIALALWSNSAEAAGGVAQTVPDETWFTELVSNLKDRPAGLITTMMGVGAAWGGLASTVGLYRAWVAERQQLAAMNPQQQADFQSRIGLESIVSLYVGNIVGEGLEWGGTIALGSMGINYYDYASKDGLNVHELAVMVMGGYQIIHEIKHAFEARFHL